MGELKSAYERALERVEKLGALSPQELRETKDAEQSAIGRALAERYLEHGYERPLVEGLERYHGDDRGVVVKGALSRLVAEIEFDNGQATDRALQGIEALSAPAKNIIDWRSRRFFSRPPQIFNVLSGRINLNAAIVLSISRGASAG